MSEALTPAPVYCPPDPPNHWWQTTLSREDIRYAHSYWLHSDSSKRSFEEWMVAQQDRWAEGVTAQSELDRLEARRAVLGEVALLRSKQDVKRTDAQDDACDHSVWVRVLAEHLELLTRSAIGNDGDDSFRQELVTIAALAVRAIESCDRLLKKEKA